ncbi:hypothetical protein CDD81_2186 [Ophiocordyceps australis]|uniref:LYR motif-containing protein Cup1-like N-terminal domain-containing protein n=1 Tax=Ophiocordyceps australis TaxID=1399860 RepID=A0A2C5XEU1_9HYPO|nr:hypothetical protein CDD81_2186 [Ophiocordyceps australis]
MPPMPAPRQPMPVHLSVAQLYRHLLRECSYLPPACRPTIAAAVKDRFDRNRVFDFRRVHHIKVGRRALRALRSANSGDKDAMTKVMLLAFGRMGFRRREIIAEFVKSEGPQNTEALEAALTKSDGSSCDSAEHGSMGDSAEHGSLGDSPKRKRKKGHHVDKWDKEKVVQIATSQKRQQGLTKLTTSWVSAIYKGLSLDADVPVKTIWDKPPCASLVKTKMDSALIRMGDKAMAPLPKGEWDLLGRLSRGAQLEAEWAIPQRRLAAKPLTDQDQEVAPGSLDWIAHAMKPAAVAEKERKPSLERRYGLRDHGPHAPSLHSSEISPRWFQRAYNRVWQMTPTTQQDPNTLKNSFKWGLPISKLVPPSKIQLQFFKGVNEKGVGPRKSGK